MSFGRLERRPAQEPMSQINVTPLVDVMLVLLVIFMLTAPFLTGSLPLNLPRAPLGAQAKDACGSLTLGHTGERGVRNATLSAAPCWER